MQHPRTCIIGIVVATIAVILRLNVGNMFTSFGWSGNFNQISRDYLNMMAWIDVFDIAIIAGLSVAAIGWLMPPPPRPGAV